MDRLKACLTAVTSRVVIYLQSSMDRLKVRYYLAQRSIKDNLQSSMDRLKDCGVQNSLRRENIYNPVWID